MKRTFITPFLFLAASALAQEVPQIRFDSTPDPLKLPENMYFGELTGVAVNSKGHVFALSRGNTSGPAYAAAATQLLEFDPQGKFIREIGKNLYAWSYGHTVRIDPQDNIWVTDKGSDMVVKFNPRGRVLMVFGRKQEASDKETGPLERHKPPLAPDIGRFRQVTDVAWDPQGNTYISDGYINSRVAKVDKNGNWLKSFGEPGAGPGQLNTPHSIAADANGNIYVADRGNRRARARNRKFLGPRPRKPPHPGVRRRGQRAARDAHRRAVPARCEAGDRRDAERRENPGRRPTAHHGARLALGHLYHAWTESRAVRLGRLSRPRLQAISRRQGARLARRVGQAAEAVRLDPRDRLSLGETAVRGRAPQLACAEAHIEVETGASCGSWPLLFSAQCFLRPMHRRRGPSARI